jgi:hypothetical protein
MPPKKTAKKTETKSKLVYMSGGKYKGLSYAEIYEKHIEYVAFLHELRQSEGTVRYPLLLEYADYMNEKDGKLKQYYNTKYCADLDHTAYDDEVFLYGKHKGDKFVDVFQKDHGYTAWALKNPQAIPRFAEYVRYMESSF